MAKNGGIYLSVTIADLLKLPSLKNAKVVAGHLGLKKIVSTISVLEYAEASVLQEELFKNNEFYGSEIVITGFINVKDNIEAQCKSIRRLHEVGEVGLILYYVGIFLPRIDETVIELANELAFTLICMPKNRMDLRYSEVIYEVMEAILTDQTKDIYLVGEMLERISLLPIHQRSMDTVLRMLSDQVTSSFFLVDSEFTIINKASWPKIGNIEFADISLYFGNNIEKLPREPMAIEINRNMCVCCNKIRNTNALPMYLIIVKEKGILSTNIFKQVIEVVQLFVNIWSQNHGMIRTEELIKAILNDEPVKMRRLADLLHIDIESIHHMMMILPEKITIDPLEVAEFNHRIMQKVKEFLANYFSISMFGIYNGCFIIFTGDGNIKNTIRATPKLLRAEISELGDKTILVSSYGLKNTTEVRNANIKCTKYLKQTRCIYPEKDMIILQEIWFAEKCWKVIEQGEVAINRALSILEPIMHNEDLLTTLEIYLLDADRNIISTANKLFIHKNTVKYRINKINEWFNFNMNKMPEAYDVYKAMAIKRLLNDGTIWSKGQKDI